MDEETRKQITDLNEDDVHKWFKASGFSGEKLDTDDGKQGKSADWKFTKQDTVVLCEVKTIFSGGQWGLTPEQYERQRLEKKRKLDHAREQAVAKVPHRKQSSIPKEEEFNKFLADVRGQLEGDESINHLPFSMSITINQLYVAYNEERQQFVEWLKGFVLWARQNHHSERIHSTSTFIFRDRSESPDGTIQHRIDAFVQVSGPMSSPSLDVGFLTGGSAYNEERVAATICEAVSQLRASMSKVNAPTVLPIVALWSESRYLSFSMLLQDDFTGEQFGDIPHRYYLFDWAFSEYPELASIILFELRPHDDFWSRSPNDRVFPVGFVITNPNLPDAEKALKATITNNCVFIPGIASDPLNDMQD